MLRAKGTFKFNGNINAKMDSARDNAQTMLSNDVLKDSNYYIPAREKYLEKSSITNSDLKNGRLIWNTPYARRLYYNPQYDFSTDVNPNAQGLWFEVAKAQKGKEWRNKQQQYYNKFFKG